MKIKRFLKSFVYRFRSEVSTEDLIKLGLTVGEKFNRQEKCIIDQSHCWLISIGNNVTLAPRVHILAHDASTWQALGYTKIAPVKIGNNVFVGAGTIILPGVTIGDNTIIGAGSVVTRDIPSNSVAIGSPSKIIGTYEEYIEKSRKLFEISPKYDESYTLRNKNITSDLKEEMKKALEKTKIGFVE